MQSHNEQRQELMLLSQTCKMCWIVGTEEDKYDTPSVSNQAEDTATDIEKKHSVHEGNNEADENGYVVLKWNILGPVVLEFLNSIRGPQID